MAVTLAEDTSVLDTTAHLESHRHFIANEKEVTSGLKSNMDEIDYESLPSDNLLAHLLAGGAAGMMEHCVMYPVDCIKTRMMQLAPRPEARYRNLTQAFRTIAATESPRVLFRGIGVVAMGAGPAHAMYFSLYEISKKSLSSKYNGFLSQGGAAVIATMAHDGFMNPVEVLKQRLQVYHSPYRGAYHCFRSVLKNEGLRAFYRSFTTQLSMNIPFQVLHFISYEFLQDHFNPSREYNPLSHTLSGGCAGACAAAVTTPLDVAKTFLNTQEQRKDQSTGRVKGMLPTLLKIKQISGFRGYFKGLSARVVYQMPSTAICWSVYEFFKYGLGLKEESGCHGNEVK